MHPLGTLAWAGVPRTGALGHRGPEPAVGQRAELRLEDRRRLRHPHRRRL